MRAGMRLAVGLLSVLSTCGLLGPAAAQDVTTPIGDGSRYLCIYLNNGTALGRRLGTKTYEVAFARHIRHARNRIYEYRYRFRRALRRGDAARSARYQALYEMWKQVLQGLRACRDYQPPKTPTGEGACQAFSAGAAVLYPKIIKGSTCGGVSAVVRLTMINFFNQELAECSGTMIAPNVVLTAAHCLTELGAAIAAVEVAGGGRRIRSSVFYAHPGFNERADHVEVNDIGLVLLPQELAVPVMPLLNAYDFTPGEQAAIAGYGTTEYHAAEGLRAGFMWLAAASQESLIAVYNGDGSNTCVGDSGGPLAVKRGASWYLAGVTSSGDNETCGLNGRSDTSTWANVTSQSNREFIRRYTGLR